MLQRSNYVLGKGGCATVYLGRVVEAPRWDSAGGAGGGSDSGLPCSPQPHHEEDRSPSSSLDGQRTRGFTTFESRPGSHHRSAAPPLSAVVSPSNGTTARATPTRPANTIMLVAVKKKFQPLAGLTGRPSTSPSHAAIEPEHELMLSIPPHENVMPIYGVSTAYHGPCDIDAGVVSFAMPLMESDLGCELKRHRTQLDELQALAVVRDVLRALAHVHLQGIAHRDVKPSNALLSRDDHAPLGVRVVLSDFGVAHRLDPDACRTASNACGTRRYQPPEQLLGRMHASAARACDSWAAGCTLFELLSGGQPAFPGETSIDTLRAIFERLGSSFATYPHPTVAPAAGGGSSPTPSSSRATSGLVDRLPAGISGSTVDLLLSLLRLDPTTRATAEAALGHPALAALEEHASHGRIPRLPVGGYTPHPEETALRFFDIHDAAVDVSDMHSTCRRWNDSSHTAARSTSTGSQPPVSQARLRLSHPMANSLFGTADGVAPMSVAGGASHLHPCPRRSLFGSGGSSNTSASSVRRSRSVFAEAAPRYSPDGAHRPSDGTTRPSYTLPHASSARSLYLQGGGSIIGGGGTSTGGGLDFSPIGGSSLSPQRRALNFDSDDDAPPVLAATT